jgi:hypothetical protein
MTYDFCKMVIEKKMFVASDMLEKLDLFFLRDRITKDEYEELVTLIEGENTPFLPPPPPDKGFKSHASPIFGREKTFSKKNY